jgi:hypothetical protein
MAEPLPGVHDPEFRETRGSGDLWVVELSISYDEGPAASASWSFAATR